MAATQRAIPQDMLAKEINREANHNDDNLLPQVPSNETSLAVRDPLQMYLLEIKHYRLLTREEEKELAIRYKEKKDMKAAHRLVTSNLRLVVKIAMDFQRHWTRALMDHIQQGNLGLIRAVEKFDPYRGIKLSYYASFWIKAYILKYIMDNARLVKLGTTQNQRKLFYKLGQEKRQLLTQGLVPEPKLLAERLDVTEREVIEMEQRLTGGEHSLSTPLGESGTQSLGERLPDRVASVEDEVSERMRSGMLSKRITEFRRKLAGRDAYIFDKRIRCEEPLTLQQIGEGYDISRERVRQIQKRLTNELSQWLNRKIPNFKEEYSDTGG
jgi:RNA polymerase sigma-32 factor